MFAVKMYRKPANLELWLGPTVLQHTDLDSAKEAVKSWVRGGSETEERAAYVFDGPRSIYSERR